jgi:hypothetical protein
MNYGAIFILTTVCIFSSYMTIAQNIEVINKSGFQTVEKVNQFSFIEPLTDTTNIKFIATIKVTGETKKEEVVVLFNKLKTKAQQLGANAFKLNSFKIIDSSNIKILILDTYYGADSAMNLNFKNHVKNIVYIFGDAEKSDKTYSFKIDNVKKEIKGGTFYKYQNKEGQKVKINKGGFSGATLWINWKENKPATFLTLTGFGLGGAQIPYDQQFGMSFNTGRINYIDGDLGHLLTTVLTQSE